MTAAPMIMSMMCFHQTLPADTQNRLIDEAMSKKQKASGRGYWWLFGRSNKEPASAGLVRCKDILYTVCMCCIRLLLLLFFVSNDQTKLTHAHFHNSVRVVLTWCAWFPVRCDGRRAQSVPEG